MSSQLQQLQQLQDYAIALSAYSGQSVCITVELWSHAEAYIPQGPPRYTLWFSGTSSLLSTHDQSALVEFCEWLLTATP